MLFAHAQPTRDPLRVAITRAFLADETQVVESLLPLARVSDAQLQRIELGAVGPGVPDVNYCIGGMEGWLELKATENWSVPFRPGQPGWIARRVRAGGRVFILTRRRHGGGPRKGEPVDELWIHKGKEVLAVNSGDLRSAETALWLAGGPRNWDWAAVQQVLVA